MSCPGTAQRLGGFARARGAKCGVLISHALVDYLRRTAPANYHLLKPAMAACAVRGARLR